jgi:aryl-alcohol dehydrogenase-like predicted oxidoreductase
MPPQITLEGVRDICKELGIGFMAYSPLGLGFLTGAIGDSQALAAKDIRLTMPRFQGDSWQHNVGLLDSRRSSFSPVRAARNG